MALSPAQLPVMKAAILAETDPTFVALRQANNENGMAAWYNSPSTFFVWKTSVATGDLFDAIQWANLTPGPAPDGTAQWTNRSLACQGKQFNLQTILTGRDAINPSKSRIRGGLQDALIDIPSGNNGALRTAGWDQVLLMLYRAANRVERVFATGAGTELAPGLLTFEGTINAQDISDALRA